MIGGPVPIKRKRPALGLYPDWSRALYPDPPSHDFCVFIVIAELMRQLYGGEAPLKVRFVLTGEWLGTHEYGATSILEKPKPSGVSKAYSDQMIENVLLPAIRMMGAVREPDLRIPFPRQQVERYCEYDYHIGPLVDAGRQGYRPPFWNPPEWAFADVDHFLAGERPVVITLREVPSQPERNSQLHEWLRFAMSIEGKYPVVFVRDTSWAFERLPFRTCLAASTDAYFRAALYQRALMNLMVCNGPNVWCIFSEAPYLIFKELVPALPDWDHGQAKGWREQDHMEVGDQYPWATPQQRLTWTNDTCEEIEAAFYGALSAQS